MHVVRGDHLDTGSHRHRGERVVAVTVERIAVVPELDEHAVAPERGRQLVEGSARRRGTVGEQRTRDGSLATAGEHAPGVVRAAGSVAGEVHAGAGVVGEPGEREARRTLLSCHLPRADRACESRVPYRSLRQHDEVHSRRIRSLVALAAGRDTRPAAARLLHSLIKGELDAEHRRQADVLCRAREAHDAVEAVVIGDGQRGEPQARGLVDQLLGMAGPVEEREVRVAVQLGVGHACFRGRCASASGRRRDGLRSLSAPPSRRPYRTGVRSGKRRLSAPGGWEQDVLSGRGRAIRRGAGTRRRSSSCRRGRCARPCRARARRGGRGSRR